MASSSSKSWTAKEIRKNAATWSLEGDDKLLGFMQTISQNLEKRAVTTKKNLNRLIFDVEHTSVALDNATNKLAALQHHQFVENRVSEDDEIVKTEKNSVLHTKEQESHNPIDILKTIVKSGLKALDECYEKVSVEIEDSDEEDEQTKSIIYRPKNPFDQRPLPYIIGTNEWKEKWHIGLCDSDEDYSDENNEQYSSDSESENISLTASLPSNAPTVSESEISSTWGPQKNVTGNLNKNKFINLSDDDDNAEDEISSNTITSKNSSEDSRNHVTQTNLINVPIPDQRYYVHKSKENNLFDESSSNDSDNNDVRHDSHNNNVLIKNNHDVINKNNIHQKIKTEIGKINSNTFNTRISNIINDEPPSDIDEVDKDRFDQKYFIENDIEYSSSETEKKIKNQNNKDETNSPSITGNQNQNNKRFDNNIRKKTINLFDDDDFNSFMKELDKRNIEKVSNKDAGSTIKTKNLFEDDETEDEASIFTPTKSTHESVQVTKVKEEDSVEKDAKIKHQENKLKENVARTKISNLFDDELQEDDDFDAIFGRKNVNKNIDENLEKLSSSNALFLNKNSNSVQINSSITNKINTISGYSSNLFSEVPPDDDNDNDDVFNVDKNYNESTTIQQENQIQPQKRINLFSDQLLNEEDNDLFSDKDFVNSTNQISDKLNNSTVIVDKDKTMESSYKSKNHTNLFNNDKIEYDNNQTDRNNTVNIQNSNNKLPNLFFDDDDDDDDDNLFNINHQRKESKITTNIVTSEKNEIEKNKKNIINADKFNSNISNLFSDNEDDDNIFEIIKNSNSSNTANNTIISNEFKNTTVINVDSIDKINSEKSQDNEVINVVSNSSNSEKNIINSNISSLMNLFSNEPPTDDESDDNIFGFKSSSKSITIDTSDVLKSSSSSTTKNNNNDMKKSGTLKLSLSHSVTNTVVETDKTNIKDLENNEKSNIQTFFKEKLNDSHNMFANDESVEQNKEIDNCKLMGEKVPKNDNEKQYNSNDNKLLGNVIKGAAENINIINKENFNENISTKKETDNVDENIVYNKEISDEINSNNMVVIKNEDVVPKNYDQITSTETVEKIVFNDLSSEDDDNFIDEKHTSIIKNSEKLSEKSTNYNTLNYNPVGLFQDIPPDDDFQISNNDQKQRHNIFYDDFSETIIPSDITTKIPSLLSSSSNYNIFSDEPPPDIFDQQIITPTQIIKKDKKDDNVIENITNDFKSSTSELNSSIKDNEQKRQSVTELAKKVNDGIKDSKSIKSSIKLPQSKKLNKNLNINVAALLPGAKRPTNIVYDNEKDSSKEILDTDLVADPVQKYSTSITADTDDNNERNILTNLNKTRAKIPVKRRPSTRKARQENYRKSLALNDENFIVTDDSTNNIFKENNSDEIEALTNDSNQIKQSDHVNTSTVNAKDDFLSISDENRENKSNTLSSNKDTLMTIAGSENLFENDDNEENENFLHKQKDANKISNEQITAVVNASSNTIVESLSSDDDDLFSQKKTIISTKINYAQKSELNDPLVSKLSTVATGTTTATTTKITAALKKTDTVFKSIFQDDSDDDDDDLFGIKTKNRNFGKQSQEQKQPIISSSTIHKQSIFSSDDDDTDLFGGKSTKKTAPITSTISHKTERTIDKPKLQLSSTIKTGSLFDDNKLDNDDDDDDDLFGSKNSKSLDKTRTVPIPKKIEKKIIASGKGLSDNPLSDLLND